MSAGDAFTLGVVRAMDLPSMTTAELRTLAVQSQRAADCEYFTARAAYARGAFPSAAKWQHEAAEASWMARYVAGTYRERLALDATTARLRAFVGA